MDNRVSHDERPVREDPANLQRGMEAVGGRLVLTNRRLVFSSHALNVQMGSTVIALSAIRALRPCWTRFLGIIPMFPNSLAILTDEAEYRFVLFRRSAWMQAIRSAMSRLPA